MHKRAFCAVSLKGPFTGEIAQAEFADMDEFLFCEGEGVGREIPGFHFMGAHGDTGKVPHARDLGLVLSHGAAGPKFFYFFFAGVGHGRGDGGCFCDGGGILYVEHVDVFVLRFRGVRGEFRGEDGDGVVGVVAVFFAAGEGRAGGSRSIFVAV